MSIIERPIVGYIAFIIALFLILMHTLKMKDDYRVARIQFANSALAEAEREARRIDGAFLTVYRVLTQVARLPGVSEPAPARQSTNAELAESVRQTYALLANKIRISKLYVLPTQHDRERSEPGRAEPEILYPFTGAARPSSVPENQSSLLTAHGTWFAKNRSFPGAFHASQPLMISTPWQVVDASKASAEKVAGGIVLSVPFYDPSGRLKGSISAVIEGDGMAAFTPSENFALVNPQNSFYAASAGDARITQSEEWVRRGEADPHLIASNTVGILAHDPRSPWQLWFGIPNSKFLNSQVVSSIRVFEIGGHLGIGMLLSMLLFMQWLGDARAREKFATQIVEETKEAHEKSLAAEREMRRLNAELEANMKKLSEAQRELVKHERLAALGQVTATLSHEIRNPLGAIRSSLYVLRHASRKAEIQLDRPLDRIERSVTRCDNLVDDFLEYTRTNDLALQSVDASEFLVQHFDEQTPPQGVVLTKELPTPGPRVAIDPERFRRVIINLVDNAAQAIKETGSETGEISVSCKQDERGSVIRVKDNGPGIPDDVFEKIFEPLFTTKSFGAGLGLATVKQLVEQHGAELEIETEVGVGSTFSVFMPPIGTMLTADVEATIQEKAA